MNSLLLDLLSTTPGSSLETSPYTALLPTLAPQNVAPQNVAPQVATVAVATFTNTFSQQSPTLCKPKPLQDAQAWESSMNRSCQSLPFFSTVPLTAAAAFADEPSSSTEDDSDEDDIEPDQSGIIRRIVYLGTEQMFLAERTASTTQPSSRSPCPEISPFPSHQRLIVLSPFPSSATPQSSLSPRSQAGEIAFITAQEIFVRREALEQQRREMRASAGPRPRSTTPSPLRTSEVISAPSAQRPSKTPPPSFTVIYTSRQTPQRSRSISAEELADLQATYLDEVKKIGQNS